MSFIFLIPLTAIALYESSSNNEYKNRWVECWLRGGDDDAENSAQNRNPTVDDPNCRGFEISKVSFEELVRVFPTAEVRLFFWVLFIRFFFFGELIHGTAWVGHLFVHSRLRRRY